MDCVLCACCEDCMSCGGLPGVDCVLCACCEDCMSCGGLPGVDCVLCACCEDCMSCGGLPGVDCVLCACCEDCMSCGGLPGVDCVLCVCCEDCTCFAECVSSSYRCSGEFQEKPVLVTTSFRRAWLVKNSARSVARILCRMSPSTFTRRHQQRLARGGRWWGRDRW